MYPWPTPTTPTFKKHDLARKTPPPPPPGPEEKNSMEDMRHAKETIATLAEHISRLRADEQASRSVEASQSPSWSPSVKRHGSNNSDGSRKSSSKWGRGGHGSNSGGVGREWSESKSGAIWRAIDNTLEEVAAEQGVNATALKEFIGSREILELGAAFVTKYRRKRCVLEPPGRAAEDLFWELQTIKQGDMPASKFTRPRAETPDWSLPDYLTRFVLQADAFRRKEDRKDWNKLGGDDFVKNTCFYLCILRCFTLRDAEQRAARERDLTGARQPPQLSEKHAKRSSQSSFKRLSRHGSGKTASIKEE
ncbi:hypothetical protein GGR53DRAFT_515614 [Hypoxylon sp. FL1150]|nr:hypothetical protein GGR53DRAFT_515614 [Hypoxylon sp. FL1150]